MVLKCPECEERHGYGRAELLGQLAVCPNCEAVFGWKNASSGRHELPPGPEAPPDQRPSGAGRRRGSGSGGKR